MYLSKPAPESFGNPDNQPTSKWTSDNWLESRFHYSFGEYQDVKYSHFGVLRVLNDDIIQPSRGFGTHAHRNMEIISYVVYGTLTHSENTELFGGSFQFMSAGHGVYHSEQNVDDTPLRIIQIWIPPRRFNQQPTYQTYKPQNRNEWHHIGGDINDIDTRPPFKLDQDVNIWINSFDIPMDYFIIDGRQAYIVCVSGIVLFDEYSLNDGDAAQVQGPILLHFTSSNCTLLIIEMHKVNWDE